MRAARLRYGWTALVFVASAVVTVQWCAPHAGMRDMAWRLGMVEYTGMWLVMMVAMMLPALAPWLARQARPLRAAAAYFAVWLLFGLLLYPIGPWISAGGAGLLLAAGLWQFTPWKREWLGNCRPDCGASGWRHGARCVACCANLTAALLVAGVMDVAAMTLATLAITVERLCAVESRARWWIGGGLILYALREFTRLTPA